MPKIRVMLDEFEWLDNPAVIRGLQRSLRSDGNIAGAVGCKEYYIRRLRQKYGIPPMRSPMGRPPVHTAIWNPDVLAALIKVYGNPYRVAEALGIDRKTMRNAIAKTKLAEKGDENMKNMKEIAKNIDLFGLFCADYRIVLPQVPGKDITGTKSIDEHLRACKMLKAHPTVGTKITDLTAKFEKNHPEYDGLKAIGFFYITLDGRADAMLIEDCVGNKGVLDFIAALRDVYPHEWGIIEKELEGKNENKN